MNHLFHDSEFFYQYVFRFCDPSTLFTMLNTSRQGRELFVSQKQRFANWYQTVVHMDTSISGEFVIYQSGHSRERRLEFHKNRKIKKMEFFMNNKLHGPYLIYDEAGRLEVEARYAKGILDGPYKAYTAGVLRLETSYKNDQLHGPYTMYERSKIKMSVVYDNGNKEGFQRTFHPDGSTESLLWFYKGKGVGNYKELYPNGVLREHGPYVEGERHGRFIRYYDVNLIESIKDYEHNVMVSEQRFYRNGVRSYEMKDGVITEFYHHGTPSSIQWWTPSGDHQIVNFDYEGKLNPYPSDKNGYSCYC